MKHSGVLLPVLIAISNLAGGMVLHKGQIAEMRTGEGKTLVAVLPAFLNSLTGQGVHVVTVNDYLARRDCEWVGQIHRFLGLRVGLIQRMFHLFFMLAGFIVVEECTFVERYFVLHGTVFCVESLVKDKVFV